MEAIRVTGSRYSMATLEQRGMLYLGLLLCIALLGIGMSAFSTVWWLEVRREKEEELLQRGVEIKEAIGSYYHLSPGTVKKYPTSLDQLIRDDRYLFVQRHLRRVPVDPMTNTTDWGLVSAPEGGIMGVFSTSTDTIHRALPTELIDARAMLNSASAPVNMSDWKFVYRSVQP